MKTYLSLGANLGAREATINQAVHLISQQAGTLLQRSAFFYSQPWGFESEHEFCNLCICIDTPLAPLDLLHTLQSIEIHLGRHRPTSSTITDVEQSEQSFKQSEIGQTNNMGLSRSYIDRPIDIDIILYEGVELHTPELTIPHPLYLQRDFVLIPLRELLPSLPL